MVTDNPQHHLERPQSAAEHEASPLHGLSVKDSRYQMATAKQHSHAASILPHMTLHESSSTGAETVNLYKLDNRAANHSTPDAVVRIPKDFDPSKPVHLVIYNHGWGSTAQSSYDSSDLDKQMENALPNSVLVVPEWQQTAGALNSNEGNFQKANLFNGMLQEVFKKVPALQSTSLDNVQDVSIFSHSAGYVPTGTELNSNGLFDKVKNITMLDSLYSGTEFDKWLQGNVKDLSSGKKHFDNFFFDSTKKNSETQAKRIQSMLSKAGLPSSAINEDFNSPKTVMTSDQIKEHPMQFKYTSVALPGLVTHFSIPKMYVGPVEQAQNDAPKAPEAPVSPVLPTSPEAPAKPAIPVIPNAGERPTTEETPTSPRQPEI